MSKRVTRVEVLPKLASEFRVAAYARVSSDKDAMHHSLSMQISYYSDLIQSHPGWQYAGVYADEAVTGTKDSRKEFQRLLKDCRAGKIDMVITKSISRLARNTVTQLQTIRELKSLGIDIFFEEANIHSIDTAGELMLTLLASFAQEESRSVSENMKWRIRKAYEKGEIMCWRFMFGYKISKTTGIEIDPEKAPIVQEVFSRIANGASLNSVVRWLNQNRYYGVFGGKWHTSKLRDLLSNEKYLGNALLQKTYINNHLEKKKLINHGELNRYYVTETHPAIIDPDTFAAAQKALATIASKNKKKHSWEASEFTGIIRCPHCGHNYRRISRTRGFGWVCATYYKEGKKHCQSKIIPEETLKETIRTALGLDTWLPVEFKKQVDFIVANRPNNIELHMHNGMIKSVGWKDRSRSESWTPEMKERARIKAARYQHD